MFLRWYLVDIWGRRIILMSGAAIVSEIVMDCHWIRHDDSTFVKMCVSLAATGWWIYVDQIITPKAVVICVIIFNAGFGYRQGFTPLMHNLIKLIP